MSGGEQVVRVPPKLMAQTRPSARTRGKSDQTEALRCLPRHLARVIFRILNNFDQAVGSQPTAA